MVGPILLYAAMLIVLGPGIMLFGVLITFRQKVRLTSAKVLDGGPAVIAGISTIISGFAFTYFLWYMARFFPP